MSKTVARARIAPNGRLSIPVELRRALGVERGGDVLLEMEGGELRLMTPAEKIRQIQERAKVLLAGLNISSEDFLAYRREQAAIEEGTSRPRTDGDDAGPGQ